MQTRAKIFDDIAKVTGGAVSTLSGIKTELENLVHQQIERILVDADMVPREEFEVVRAMAAKARSKQQEMEKRILRLEKITELKAPNKIKKKSRSKAKK